MKGFTRPPRVRKGFPVKSEEFNLLSRGIEELQNAFSLPISKKGRGGATGGCIPWKPKFTVVSGTNYVSFNLGLLNQIAADNWNTAQVIDPEATVWPTLDVTASNGKITGYTIDLETAPPTEDQQNDNTPPSSFKIVLGVIESLTPCMVVTENLEAIGTEVFRKSKTPTNPGDEPFTRVWRWKVNANTSGDYPYIT